ncbi:MAG TPA: preprotein translocase subunit SecY [Longimicrobiales bacterium]
MANPIPALFKVPELKEKILFTLLVLLIYRFGAHITVPGVNYVALELAFQQFETGLLGVYDLFVGGALSKATVLALGIMPYISASIMFQLLAAVFPAIEKMQKEGEDGRKKLTQWTRYATIGLAMMQGFGYSMFLQTLNAQAGADVVQNTGPVFAISSTLIFTIGAVFVMWLGEQITERGIGNGMSLLIFFSIIQGFPNAAFTTWQQVTTGVISWFAVIMLLVMMVAVIAGVVAMTMAARKIPVQIPRKVMGRGRVREGQKSFIPLRINSAGVMPIIFAQSIIIIPGTAAQFSSIGFLRSAAEYLQPGATLYNVLYALLILFFTYFYTSIIFNPVDLAENLKKQGGFIPGVKPGARTAEYIDYVLSRVTIVGAVYLALIALLPFWIIGWFNLGNTFFFGGTSLLIVVGVALDTVQQMQQHMLLRHYEGFMKKGRVRFRGRQRYM